MLKVDNDWREFLEIEIEKPYFKQLKETLVRGYSEHTVFPPKHLIEIIADKTPCFSYGDTVAIFLLIACISLSSMI